MAVIETHENKNEVEITNNELLPRIGVGRVPNPVVPTCDVNNGGCDQICNMVQKENSDALIAECSCRLGYYLDSEEEKHCIGKCFLFFKLNLLLILSARHRVDH